MTRAERKQLRARYLAKGRGRPAGKVPFSKNKNRFEIVWAQVFASIFGGLKKYQAAYLTTVWLHSDEPMTISQLGELHARVSADYAASLNEEGVDELGKRAQYLVECWNEVEANIHSWRAKDRDWYLNSRAALYCFLQFGMRGVFKTELAQALSHLGWKDALTRVFGRLSTADVIPASKREREEFAVRVLPKLRRNQESKQALTP